MKDNLTCLNCFNFIDCKIYEPTYDYTIATECTLYNQSFEVGLFYPQKHILKEKQMDELKITKEKVLKASQNCPQAKEVLKELFPEAFEVQYKDFDFCIYESNIRLLYQGTFYDLFGNERARDHEGIQLEYKYVGNLQILRGRNDFAEYFISMLKDKK
jgi:hypothetical protein